MSQTKDARDYLAYASRRRKTTADLVRSLRTVMPTEGRHVLKHMIRETQEEYPNPKNIDHYIKEVSARKEYVVAAFRDSDHLPCGHQDALYDTATALSQLLKSLKAYRVEVSR